MRPTAVLPLLAWAAIVAAALLDGQHDPVQDYISWLVGGPWGWLAGLGVAGLVLSSLEVAWRLHQDLPAGPLRQAMVTSLVCAAALGVAVLVLPSRGVGEPAWRTAVHVGLAVGAYTGVAGAAAGLAWLARQGLAPRRMMGWAVAIFLALGTLGVVSAVARLGPWDVELRGLAQLLLVGAAALWLARAGGQQA